MDPADRPKPSAPAAVKWLAPPWSVPAGRKPTYRRRLAEIAPLWAAWAAPIGALPLILAVRGVDPGFEPLALVYAGLAVSALAYGVYSIATAQSHPRKTVWMFPGLTGTRTATIWYGLVFVLPVAIEIGVVAFVLVTESSYSAAAELFVFAGWPVMVACALVARRASNEPVKQTILSGLAPSYILSTEWPRWWWDGSEWVGFGAAAPDDAVRSPDGNYWWSGAHWVALPPLDKLRRAVAPA
jgi:hypothetical protein